MLLSTRERLRVSVTFIARHRILHSGLLYRIDMSTRVHTLQANSSGDSKDDIEVQRQALQKLFSRGCKVYTGYMDDDRNTDNAWIETTCVNYHDSDGEATRKTIHLQAGDDAAQVRWAEYHPGDTVDLELHADHARLLALVYERVSETNPAMQPAVQPVDADEDF
eukprot:m.1521955 g.1521955  ORF g.1521955 m.1521955 type:complete len:165 (+) comp25230_c0_seq2:91-585(+)